MENSVPYPTHIIVGRTQNFGSLFSVLNLLPENYEVLEAFPVGSGGHFVLEVLDDEGMAETQFADWKHSLSNQGIKLTELEFFKNISSKILDAYLSLNSPSDVTGSLLIVEGQSLNAVIHHAQTAIEQGGELIDLRFLRGSEPKAFCFVTGLSGELRVVQSVTQTYIPQVNSSVSEYFNTVKRLSSL